MCVYFVLIQLMKDILQLFFIGLLPNFLFLFPPPLPSLPPSSYSSAPISTSLYLFPLLLSAFFLSPPPPQAYLSCDDGVQVGKVQWKIDFSGCGLVISRVEVKAKWMEFGEEGEESIQFTVVGDNRVICAPYLEGG